MRGGTSSERSASTGQLYAIYAMMLLSISRNMAPHGPTFQIHHSNASLVSNKMLMDIASSRNFVGPTLARRPSNTGLRPIGVHDSGFIHLDFKPENIIVTPNANVQPGRLTPDEPKNVRQYSNLHGAQTLQHQTIDQRHCPYFSM